MKNTLLIIVTALVLFSCKTVNLFEGEPEENNFQEITRSYEHILTVDDKISVSVWDHYDLSIGSIYTIYNTNEGFGKWLLIKKDSTINAPDIGVIKVGGLTRKQAEKKIAAIFAEKIQNAVVEIKVLNRYVTVLGEVKAPGNYVIEKEVSTLIEAIGRAEGINYYGDIKKIKIIRDGKTKVVNLNKIKDFTQKNVLLKSGDIIIIPSRKGMQLDKKAPSIIPFASLMTAIGILISVSKR